MAVRTTAINKINRTCECGCGKLVRLPEHRFINNHHIKGKKQTPESIAKRVKARKGKRWTEEQRKRQSIAQKKRFQTMPPSRTFGRVPSKEERKRISKGLEGHVTSEETKRKISKSLMGHMGANKGKHMLEEQKRKMRLAAKKRIQEGRHNNARGRSGWFYSKKNNKRLHYRSHLERDWYKLLERLDFVQKYKTEPVSISYIWKGGIHLYIPDLLVYLKNGTIDLIEIKPEYIWNNGQNKAKWKAAKKWCEKRQKIRSFKVFGYDRLRKLA